jgi:hypothetical protein
MRRLVGREGTVLTGTCDVCHETMPFAEHLAGTAVQCKRCGQGWVHVAASTDITASLPTYPEQRINKPPDTGIVDQCPWDISAPLGVHRPAPGACPRCGSTAFKRLKAQQGTALDEDRARDDRECKECGTRYTIIPAPMSITVRTAMYMSGALLLLGGILAVFVRLTDMQGPGGMGVSSFSLYTVFFSVLVGFRLITMPQQRHQLRDKCIKEYQASASPDAPRPVEMPELPDMVFLSVIFGILALASPCISALLLVILFGPAALVCGVHALFQGHLKGLIGIVLAIVSLIVWGAVFLYFFLG